MKKGVMAPNMFNLRAVLSWSFTQFFSIYNDFIELVDLSDFALIFHASALDGIIDNAIIHPFLKQMFRLKEYTNVW